MYSRFEFQVHDFKTKNGNHAKLKYLHQLKGSSHRQKCLSKVIWSSCDRNCDWQNITVCCQNFFWNKVFLSPSSLNYFQMNFVTISTLSVPLTQPKFWTVFPVATIFGLRQFLASESPLKKDEKCFFTLKALFVFKIFNYLSSLFGHVGKLFD